MTILSLFAITLFIIKKITKSISHPAFIWGSIWLLVIALYELTYILNIIDINELSLKAKVFYYFGFLLFSIGSYFATGTKSKIKNPRFFKQKINKKINAFLHLTAIVLLPFYILKANSLVSSSSLNTDNWLMLLRYSLNVEEMSMGLYSYIIPLAFFNFFIRVIGFGGKKDYWIAFTIALTYALLSTGRTFFLLIFIVIIADSLLKKKYKNIFLSIIAFSLVFIFIGSTLVKFDTNESQLSSYLNGILTYLIGGVVAFDLTYLNSTDLSISGIDNTLRTPIALLYSLGAIEEPPAALIRNFVYIPFPTNVFTVYEPYIQDFGLFSLLIMMPIGVICGIFYRYRNSSFIFRYAYYISLYPIIMSIFQDQFFSLLSFWIQFTLLIITFYYTNRFFINDRYYHR